VASVKREISSADRRAVNLLLTVPFHSDAFHSMLATASVSAVHQAYEKSSGSRRTAIGEKLESLISLTLPHPRHD
jgi:hypothetical protein